MNRNQALRFASMAAIAWAGCCTAAARAQNVTPNPQQPGTAATTTQQDGAQSSPVQPVAAGNTGDGEQAAGATGTDVVVTGIRASLATALDAKKNADNIQEDLSAEDIGKLPDNNIAESLARLPGISTNRDRGNPTTISIRGMPAELTNTLLNGREIVSGDANRNIRYDEFPAELITGASVYKSPTAAQVDGAIAGQVDLKTIRPLDYKKSQVVLSARGEFNDLSHDVTDAHEFGYIASGSYVGQFAGDTLGVALGISARDEPVATERTNIYRYTGTFSDLNGDGKTAPPPESGDLVPYGFEALKRGGSDKRIGGLATVQWRPNERFELNGDFFYSHVNYDEYQRGFSVQGLPFGNDFSNLTELNGYEAVAGTATSNAYYGIELQNNNQYYTYTDDLYAGGLNARYDAGRFHIVGDFGYSTTTRHAMFVNEYTEAVYPGTGYKRNDGVTVNWLTRPGQPSTFSFGQSLLDPSLNELYVLTIPTNGNGAPIIDDSLYSGKADVAYDVDGGFVKALQAGVRYTDRTKDLTQRTQYSGYFSQATPVDVDPSLAGAPLTWSGAFAGLPSSQTWDVFGVADQYFGGINPTESVSDQQSSWKVQERTIGGYVQADFDHAFGGVQLTGNVGVRVVNTREDSRGALVNGTGATTTVTPTEYVNEFTDWLPELNATLHIDSHQQVRFALSKAIARAPLDYLSASYGLYTTGGAPAAYGGNPQLEPYRADQVDLTYEHYFNRDTALTLSLFYKNLETFIIQQQTTIPADPATNTPTGTFNQPVNGHGGDIKGFEVLYQQAFSFLPKPLDGFGVYANFSYTDSSVQVQEYDNAIGTTPLPGLSKTVYNLSLYYSKYGIDASVAYRYRSSFATQTGDTDRLLFNRGEGILSAQASYTFPDNSALRGVKLLVQGDNLTNTPYELYYGDPALQGRYETFGRTFFAGASLRF